MLDIFRDSTVGLVINTLSNGKILPYADQDPSWDVPANFLASSPSSSVSEGKRKEETPETERQSPDDVEAALPRYNSINETTTSPKEGSDQDQKFITSLKKQEEEVSVYEVAPSTKEPSRVLVNWYDQNDQDNPQ